MSMVAHVPLDLDPRSSDDDVDLIDDAIFDHEVETQIAGVEHLIVRLAGGRYAIHALDVVEVIRMPRLTRLPGAPAWLDGVANWRGRVLPVIDLRPLLDLPSLPLPSSARTVVVGVDGVEVGVVAEAVTGLLTVPDVLAPVPDTMAPGPAQLLRGLTEDSTRGLVGVLETTEILALRTRR